MAIEKYGVDRSTIPPTDDQIEELELVGEEHMPKTAAEADVMIEKIAREK